jgi:tRNA threonylcarbamoyladenosine biosynthesis protein TsaE
LRLPSPSPEATRAAALSLAVALGDGGLVIALTGPLGAGKSVFARGLAEGLGVDPARVASPTFTIASEYETRDARRFAHVDLYRIGSESELEDAGFLDLLTPGAVVVVEWSDRLPGALPSGRLEIRIERPAGEGAPTHRVLNAVAFGEAAVAVLARWRDAEADRADGATEG